ncbi:MAG: histidine kinase [Spirochaetaceae bacterium]|nr:histidine kinase [Spirochaetaceae bacterium]
MNNLFPSKLNKVTKRRIRKFCLVLSFLLFFIIILAGYIRLDITKDMLSLQQQFLAKYVLNLENEITSPFLLAIEKISIVTKYANIDNVEDIQDSLNTFRANNSSFVRDIEIIKSIPNSDEYLEISPYYVKSLNYQDLKYYDIIKDIKLDSIATSDGYRYSKLQAFRDDMSLSTLMPILVKIDSTPEHSEAMAIIICDITNILSSLKNNYSFSSLGEDVKLEVSIYDQNYQLYETSKNLILNKYNVLYLNNSLANYNGFDSSLGLFSKIDETSQTMLAFNDDFGLYFSASIPINYIRKDSKKFWNYIMFLSIICLIVVIVIIKFLFNVANEYKKYEIKEAEAKFDSLQARMNPHFLFNSLDSVSYAIEDKDERGALKSLKSLSYILRFDLRDTDKLIPLTQQIKYIRNYINLQEIRYSNRFSFDFDIMIDENLELDNIYILKYCIQPLVDNCFKHGVYKKSEHMNIKVTYRNTQDSLIICVIDDGPNITEAKAKELNSIFSSTITNKDLATQGMHLGLKNIHQRIRLLFGSKYGLQLLEVEKGFSIQAIIPLYPKHFME